jgi:hypothetical protein
MLVFGPSVKAMAVAIEVARALWLEGMPPVFQRKVTRTSWRDLERERRILMTAFRNWAVRRLLNAERNTGFLNRSPPPGRALKLTIASFPEARKYVKAEALAELGVDPRCWSA